MEPKCQIQFWLRASHLHFVRSLNLQIQHLWRFQQQSVRTVL